MPQVKSKPSNKKSVGVPMSHLWGFPETANKDARFAIGEAFRLILISLKRITCKDGMILRTFLFLLFIVNVWPLKGDAIFGASFCQKSPTILFPYSIPRFSPNESTFIYTFIISPTALP